MTDQPDIPTKTTERRGVRLNLSAWVLLPALAAFAIAAYLVIGGMPNGTRSITPDLMRWLVILPIVTVWWGVVVVSAAATIMIFMWEPARGTEAGWTDMVLAGRGAVTGDIGRNARWLLIRNDIRWGVLLLLSGTFHLLLGARIMAYAGGLGVAG